MLIRTTREQTHARAGSGCKHFGSQMDKIISLAFDQNATKSEYLIKLMEYPCISAEAVDFCLASFIHEQIFLEIALFFMRFFASSILMSHTKSNE